MITLGYPTYNPYRPLSFDPDDPVHLEGEDVFALQNGINALQVGALVVDGVLLEETSAAIWAVQEKLSIIEDGIAGGQTQRAIALWIVRHDLNRTSDPKHWQTRRRLAKGHIQRESSYLLGNYSQPQRLDGTFDAGVTQMNTEHHALELGFDPGAAIPAMLDSVLAAYKRYGDKTRFRGDDHTEKRRWALAAGSWNAPYWANWFAGVKPDAIPSATQQIVFEQYMKEAVVYL